MAGFRWTSKRLRCAQLLAEGYTFKETAAQAGVGERSIYRWQTANPEFSTRVNELALEMGLALRAERVRLAKRIIRKRLELAEAQGLQPTEKDLLDWAKFLQSETTGAALGEGTIHHDLMRAVDGVLEQIFKGGGDGPG